MNLPIAAILLAALAASPAAAQFEILDAKTTASLRGIDALSEKVAWASGSGGTVLLTTDGGETWKHCAVPPKGEKLDFRGVQGFDVQTAVIMASGKGLAAAVYKTTDGCDTWKMVFANPDADGFFDALRKVTGNQMYLMGDQVGGRFAMFSSADQGSTWIVASDPGLEADKGDGGFAASNSGMISIGTTIYFATGGGAAAHVYSTAAKCADGAAKDAPCPLAWSKTEVPMAAGSAGAGIFSLAGRTRPAGAGGAEILVAVGGDYQKPDASSGTAAVSAAPAKWKPAVSFPHGYRSAVVFQAATQGWIAVGPNGCDVSKDDGMNWVPLRPGAGDAPDADRNWNAISLPFVVGSKGKIGRLRKDAVAK